jgi:transcriptional regulator with XRE-family HTH domain
MDVGHLLFRRRQELGMTLQDVGDAVGVTKSTVKKWETGYIKNMGRDKLAKLALVLEISPADLVDIPEIQPALSLQDDTGKLYAALSPEDREIVDRVIRGLASKQ